MLLPLPSTLSHSPVPLTVWRTAAAPVYSLYVFAQQFQQQHLSRTEQQLFFPPSLKAFLLIRLFIQSHTGRLLILGHMGHWKISDSKVFMRRYSQSRSAQVQMLLLHCLDTAEAVIFLLERKHIHTPSGETTDPDFTHHHQSPVIFSTWYKFMI